MLDDKKKASNKRYDDKTYTRKTLIIRKEECGEICNYIQQNGYSFNGYVLGLIRADMELSKKEEILNNDDDIVIWGK